MKHINIKSSKKQLSISITTLVLLCICLCTTTFALSYTLFEVQHNRFQTGGIDIDLNGGKPIITSDEYLFEPGMTVEKPFYIQNNGTWAVYYKLYFSNVKGRLGDVLEVTVLDEDGTVLLSDTMSAITRENALALADELDVGERQDLTVQFHFPEGAGNSVQSDTLTFELSAVAVQTKNNPDREFE